MSQKALERHVPICREKANKYLKMKKPPKSGQSQRQNLICTATKNQTMQADVDINQKFKTLYEQTQLKFNKAKQ